MMVKYQVSLTEIFTAPLVAFGLVTVLTLGLAGSAFGQTVSHRVVYDLDMHNVSSAAQVETIDGQTHYSLRRVCDGWETIEDYAISFGFGQDGQSNFISHYQTWESFAGDAFTFTVTENSTLDGDKQYDGFANIGQGMGEAFYSVGQPTTRELPDNTMLPMKHMLMLLDRARNGERVYQSNLFLGGDQDGSLYFVNSVMGKRKSIPADDSIGDLAEDGYWPITIAYYDPDAVTPEPEYEITFRVQDNGVIRSYIVKYSDFSMRATLRSAEEIDAASC